MANVKWFLVFYTLRGESRVLRLSSRVSAELFASSVKYAGATRIKIRRA
jgi:hypothetical protein